jgi:uncharacterized protein with PIN domain
VKFLCDQMLARLGKWLRAAGYDTLIIDNSMPDKDILVRALKEGRYLITRDRHFFQIGSSSHQVIWLESNLVEECATELSKKLPVDWLKDPFSRCIECNQLLEDANDQEIQSLPEKLLEKNRVYHKCTTCNKLYWLGTHTDRMLEQLKKWKISCNGI